MPRIGQMFPSKFLQPEDLTSGITVVTIREVAVLAAQRRSQGADLDDLETQWMIKFDEFKKPCKLKVVNARTIADVLKSDMTEDWIGQTIGIYPNQIAAYGKIIPVINVDFAKPQTRPGLNQASIDRRPIGQAAASRFVGHLNRAGKSFDDFLRWLKSNVAGGIDLAFGVELHELPAALLTSMKAYLDSLAVPAADSNAPPAGAGLLPPPAESSAPVVGTIGAPGRPLAGFVGAMRAGEVVDRSTGEVVTAAPASRDLDDKEIPF